MQDTIPFLTTIITKAEADEMNPLVLAFVGDSVQQLYVRTRLAISSDKKSGALFLIEGMYPEFSLRKTAAVSFGRRGRGLQARKKRALFVVGKKRKYRRLQKSKRFRGSSRIPVSHGKTRPPERIAFNRIRRTHVNYGKKRSV